MDINNPDDRDKLRLKVSEILIEIGSEIFKERLSQEAQWGQQNHDPSYWMVILMEEVGEACHEICGKSKNYWNYRKELIQVAAVAFAAIESLDRGMEGEDGGG